MERLEANTRHPSAKNIFEALKEGNSDISLATVYNTLGVLHRSKLIKVIEFEGKENRYDTNIEPHINLICIECGSISDLEEGCPNSPERVLEELGFDVTDYRMEYYGVCSRCRARKEIKEGR